MTIRQGRLRIWGCWALIGLVGLGLFGCETNPYTKRSQLMLISESEEQQMGLQAYQQVLSDPKNKLSNDPREVEPVKRVAARIVAAAKVSQYSESANQFQWQVVVIKDDKTDAVKKALDDDSPEVLDEHLRAGIALGMFPEAAGREEQWLAERMANRRTPRGPVERRRQDGRWLLVDDQRLPDGGPTGSETSPRW